MIKQAIKFYSLKELWKNIKSLPLKRKYLAGGSDLIISLKNLDIDCLIDISDIKELRVIKENKDNIFIGAAVKISEIEDNDCLKKYAPAIVEAAKFYASPSIRNIATIGGNIANASPCADGVLALISLQSLCILNYYGKRRIVKVMDLIKDVKKTILRKDEIIEGFIIPKKGFKSVFLKMMPRKAFGIAKAGLCVSYIANKYYINDISIAVSSVGPKIIKCIKTEKFLKNKFLNEEIIKKASLIIRKEISPISDYRSTAYYRTEIISTFLVRALNSIK